MSKFLLGLALAIFAVWLALTILGVVVHEFFNLLWVLAIIALLIWLVRVLAGRSRAQ